MLVFGASIGSIGLIEEKMIRKENNRAVMSIEQTTEITTVYI